MDSILHYTHTPTTLVATVAFVVAFLLGVWGYARFGRTTLLPSLVIALVAFGLRAVSPPLSFNAIGAVTVLHLAVGCLTAWVLNRGKSS
jgi:hypothetical protein